MPKKGKELTDSDVADIEHDKKIFDNLTVEDNSKASPEELYRLWEETMHTFNLEEVTTFYVKGSSAATLFEDISYKKPTEIHAAYYTQTRGQTINMFIMDPQNQVIFKRSAEEHGILDFKTTVPGRYTFIFSNIDDHNEKIVTFALHTFEESKEITSFEINEQDEVVNAKDEKIRQQ